MSNMKKRESLEELKKYPVFRHWRAKAEAHEYEMRPMEAADLEKKGELDRVIDSRTESFWNALVDAKAAGSNQHEAEEIALPHILLESESEERERVLDEMEQMENQ
jgi:hypothetical protein